MDFPTNFHAQFELQGKLDKDRRVMVSSELNDIEGAELLGEHDNCSEDIYYVFVEKIEGYTLLLYF